MPSNERKIPTYSQILKFLYLIMLLLSVYLLYLSRRDEIYTVWGAIHPAFLPTYFITTFLLLAMTLTVGKVEHKLLLIILHSVVSHSFFVIMFPAGNIGVPQVMLGRTRLVFDNITFPGFGGAQRGLFLMIYSSLKGQNLQTAVSTIFARMLGMDVYWTHLLLIPLLWGIFVPLIAFMISKTVGLNENISALSGVLVSLFPTSIVWGYASIPNGLGYLFFFCFIYFLLKYFQSSSSKDLFLTLVFLAISALSHYLAGTMALSLLLLAYGVKAYHKEKKESPISAKFALFVAFIFCTSILPFALAYRRLFYPSDTAFFSLNRFREAPLIEMFLPFLLGSYFDLISRNAIITALIFGLAPMFGLIGLVYILCFKSRETSGKAIFPSVLFLFIGFLLVVAGDRIVKFFMVRVPFVEPDRLWVFRDLIATPFTALLIGKSLSFSEKIFSKLSRFMSSRSKRTINLGPILAYFLVFILLSGWITMSVYYSYPHYGPLQTTTYEIEAVKHIDQTTQERYIVIADQWIIFAGQMFVGIKNPRAFYFSHVDPHGVTFFIQMKNNPSNETLIDAMKTNNATVAYFIIEKPRLGTEEYNRIKSQAMQNDLKPLPLPKLISHYRDEEKLCIFYYEVE